MGLKPRFYDSGIYAILNCVRIFYQQSLRNYDKEVFKKAQTHILLYFIPENEREKLFIPLCLKWRENTHVIQTQDCYKLTRLTAIGESRNYLMRTLTLIELQQLKLDNLCRKWQSMGMSFMLSFKFCEEFFFAVYCL